MLVCGREIHSSQLEGIEGALLLRVAADFSLLQTQPESETQPQPLRTISFAPLSDDNLLQRSSSIPSTNHDSTKLGAVNKLTLSRKQQLCRTPNSLPLAVEVGRFSSICYYEVQPSCQLFVGPSASDADVIELRGSTTREYSTRAQLPQRREKLAIGSS